MIVPYDGMIIEEDTKLQPGTYIVGNGMHIAEDGVTLDGNGALLIGKNRDGHGIHIEDRRDVTVKNLSLQQYEHGIYAKRCRNLTIERCHIRSTLEIDANTVFLNIWLPVERAYGGAILFDRVEDSRILNNDLQHQMNGVLAYGCKRLNVRGNLANYSSGFGFHLYDTSDSIYEENFADFCCRYEPRDRRHGHMGADSAGFLIAYNSCRNIFRRNFARMSGDGFFLAGLTAQLEAATCDDNLFEENDASYSPNIAFEATFSRGNVYRDNIANHCNYGFWLGFSRENVVERNEIVGNRQAGIAVENGIDMQVRGNTIKSNAHGILLWSKYIADFAEVVPDNDTSRDWLIEKNKFEQNGKAIRIAADQDHGVRPLAASRLPKPRGHVIRKNEFRGNQVEVELLNVEDTTNEDNRV